MSTSTEHELLTVAEVCALLRIRPSTIYEATRTGRVPCVVLWRGSRKRLLRFRRTDVEALIAGHAAVKESRPR